MIDGDSAVIESERVWLSQREQPNAPPVEMIAHATWAAMQRLVETGLLQFTSGTTRRLYGTDEAVNADVMLPAAE